MQQGVLGTVNVLRELTVDTWTNRVTATAASPDFSPDWGGGPVAGTIDGGAVSDLPKKPSDSWIFTYRLPSLLRS